MPADEEAEQTQGLRPVLWPIYVCSLLLVACWGGTTLIFSPYLQTRGFSMASIGSTVALFGIFSLISRLPSGALYSYRRCQVIITIAMAMLVMGILALPIYTGYWLAAIAALGGFTFGMISTWMLALLMDITGGKNAAGLAGTYSAYIAAGHLLGSFSTGFLVDYLGFSAAFKVMGIGILVSLLLFQLMPFVQMPQQPRGTRPRRSWRESLAVLRGLNINVYLGAFWGLFINIAHSAINAFFPIYALGVGLSMSVVGVTSSTLSLTALLVRILSPILVRKSSYRWLNILMILVAFGVMFAIPFSVAVPVFLALFAVSGIARGLVRVTSMVYTMEESQGKGAAKGLASGIYHAGLDTGQFIGPIVAGMIAQATGIPAMFKLLAIGLFVIFIVIVIWEARSRLQKVSQSGIAGVES